MTAWDILASSAFFILVGFVIAALLDAMITADRVVAILSHRRKRSVFLATLMGAPLPLCSCSVLPTALTLRRKGASKGATISFLISTPETSVTSILLSYALLGPLLAIYRPLAACVTAITAGLVELVLERGEAEQPAAEAEAGDEPHCPHCDTHESTVSLPVAGEAGAAGPDTSWRGAFRRTFVDLFDDIFGWIMVGILFAAALQVFLPPDVMARVMGGPLQSMLLMTVIGVPLYVCAEASTPIAAVLLAQGLNPGAALVFLLVGPATNIGGVGVLTKQLGKRTVIVYLASIVVVALLMGMLLNFTLAGAGITIGAHVMHEGLVPMWLKNTTAVIFLLLGLGTIRRAGYARRLAGWLDQRLPVPVSAGGLKVTLVLVAVLGYFASGFYVVGAGQTGIHKRFGALHNERVTPGLHYALPWPIDSVDRVRINRVRRMVLGAIDTGESASREDITDGWSLVGDENMASMAVAVHWAAVEDQLLDYQYGVADPAGLVRSTVLAAVREVVGGASINTILTSERIAAEQAILALAQQRLESYRSGIRLHAVQVLDAHAPPEVHAAFRDVASALEDRATRVDKARAQEARLVPAGRSEAHAEVAIAKAYAAATVSQARGEAERFEDLLEVYRSFPGLTRFRLEMEKLEQVLPRLQKYIKPPAAGAGELEFWFVAPEAAGTATMGTNR